MAKFLKSIFHAENARTASYDGQPDDDKSSDSPTLHSEIRRKLSISRSGRMKQAQKKRLSLSMDIYGTEIDIQSPEKPKAVEYHVSQLTQARENPLASSNQRRRSRESMSSTESGKVVLKGQGKQVTMVTRVTTDIKTPEEEIDNAFGIIDRSYTRSDDV